ncbi:hypothetical protein [Sphingomonas crusticola]|uniref:hypothetical protein n=1 Tax=Sphingomonas crusticola TaxID=1697973 RepID=UPI0013C2BAA1|nr:hypothetical protein [Sphingomonas crusticola]
MIRFSNLLAGIGAGALVAVMGNALRSTVAKEPFDFLRAAITIVSIAIGFGVVELWRHRKGMKHG